MPNTLFLGKDVMYLPSCHSTNSYLSSLLASEELNDGFVLITDTQLAGQGQMGTTWEAEPYKNLTFSLYLKTEWLAIRYQFYISMVVALAIKETLAIYIKDDIHVKWPNDIFIKKSKIAGVLIKNTIVSNKIKNTIVGIGLNINQLNFSYPLATSILKITSKVNQPNQVFSVLLTAIEKYYLELKNHNFQYIKNLYEDSLFQNNNKAQYIIKGNLQEAIIKGVEDSGMLKMLIGDEIKHFDLKEIKFVNS